MHPPPLPTGGGAIACAIAALFCYGIGDFIFKRAAGAGIAAEHFLMAQAWFFCPGVIAYALIAGTLVPVAAAAWGGLVGVLILVAFLKYIRSLRTGAVSVVAPVFRLNFLVTVALAAGWLGETLTAGKLAGCAMALAAAWLLLGGGSASGPAPTPRASSARHPPAPPRGSLVPVVVATLAMGAANFCYKLGLLAGATPETLLVAQAVVFTGLVTGMNVATRRSVRVPSDVFAYAIPSAAVLLAAFLLLLHGLRLGQASVVVPITQMGFVITACLGVALLREAVTARKLAGLCAAVASLLALALG